jgi:hypothetical protein
MMMMMMMMMINICFSLCLFLIHHFYYDDALTEETPELSFVRFTVHGSLHRKSIPIYIQQDAKLHSLFISVNCSTCFGWYLHPSSGAHTTVSTASGTCQTVTATCRYRGRDGTPEQFHLFHDSGR